MLSIRRRQTAFDPTRRRFFQGAAAVAGALASAKLSAATGFPSAAGRISTARGNDPFFYRWGAMLFLGESAPPEGAEQQYWARVEESDRSQLRAGGVQILEGQHMAWDPDRRTLTVHRTVAEQLKKEQFDELWPQALEALQKRPVDRRPPGYADPMKQPYARLGARLLDEETQKAVLQTVPEAERMVFEGTPVRVVGSTQFYWDALQNIVAVREDMPVAERTDRLRDQLTRARQPPVGGPLVPDVQLPPLIRRGEKAPSDAVATLAQTQLLRFGMDLQESTDASLAAAVAGSALLVGPHAMAEVRLGQPVLVLNESLVTESALNQDLEPLLISLTTQLQSLRAPGLAVPVLRPTPRVLTT